MKIEEVTIVIQGRVNVQHIGRWVQKYKDWNVIISTWNEYDLNITQIPEKWTILQFPKPKKRFFNVTNLDLQILSTLNGLRYVETPYTIKARGDEYFSNLHSFLNEMEYKKDKVICSDVFFRGLQKGSFFHISDHLIGSSTENIKIMFQNTWDLLIDGWLMPVNTVGPENYLGYGFIKSKEKLDINQIELHLTDEFSQPLFEKWFDYIPMSKLAPYVVVYHGKDHDSQYPCHYHF
jgi:hypothetical protein